MIFKKDEMIKYCEYDTDPNDLYNQMNSYVDDYVEDFNKTIVLYKNLVMLLKDDEVQYFLLELSELHVHAYIFLYEFFKDFVKEKCGRVWKIGCDVNDIDALKKEFIFKIKCKISDVILEEYKFKGNIKVNVISSTEERLWHDKNGFRQFTQIEELTIQNVFGNTIVLTQKRIDSEDVDYSVSKSWFEPLYGLDGRNKELFYDIYMLLQNDVSKRDLNMLLPSDKVKIKKYRR